MASSFYRNKQLVCVFNNIFSKKIKFDRKFSTSKCRSRILTSVFPDVTIPDVSLPDFIIGQTEKYRGKIALECFDSGRQYTYDELPVRINALAASLRNRFGLQDGDAVCIILPNVAEYPIITLGIIKANYVCSTCNPIYKSEEIKRQLINSTAKLIITVDTVHENVDKANKSLENPLPIIVLRTKTTKVPEGTTDFEELVNPNTNTQILSSLKKPSPNDTILRMYSSGTTGLPKGVDLTQRNMVANLLQQVTTTKDITPHIPEDFPQVIPGILPFFHIFGLSVVMMGKFLFGHKIINLPEFTVKNFVELFKKYKPHGLYAVPPIVLLMISQKDLTAAEFENLAFIMAGAAPLGETDINRLRKKLPPITKVVQGYGLTETSPLAVCYNRRIKNYNAGSIGILIPSTEARIVNTNTGEDVPDGEEGEFWIRGPQVMKGYYNNEQATKDCITPDGWFKTGDIARVGDEDQIYITDRLKELIKVKGFQVAPAELEAILRTHPAVEESAVIGVPHPFFGEAPKAFVVLRKGHSASEKELQDFVAQQTADFKHLVGGVDFLDVVPKSPSGKILRRQLRQ